ncbi:hypothetical protein MHH60_26535 [Paenibacillus sp. FSL H7-0716]|uniref:Uncharacterized protein n=1 Tax=Paenibacillus odorifer TaxID=189426 RepID=A0AB36J694_9BACL|nr:hypothetical protein [Paenibacillus odorifer]OME08062.1 hypothetical protein BSK60_30720 [Paenibacillus odorifer]OME11228.1 hypothetical protein BSK47_29490 [Paenibacillus odorifer]
MKIDPNFVLKFLRESDGSHYATAIGIIRNEIHAKHSPFSKIRNVKIVLDALDTLHNELIQYPPDER